MPEMKLLSKGKNEAIVDLIQSSALQKAALAELLNAGAEEMREVMKFSDANIDKLINFQGGLDSILQSGIEMEKTIKDDVNSILEHQKLAELLDLNEKELVDNEEEAEDKVEAITDNSEEIDPVIEDEKDVIEKPEEVEEDVEESKEEVIEEE